MISDIPDLISDDSEDEEAIVARAPRPPRPDAEALLTLGVRLASQSQRICAHCYITIWRQEHMPVQRSTCLESQVTEHLPFTLSMMAQANLDYLANACEAMCPC